MYDIRKGWPSDGAIDEVLKAAPNQTIEDGMIVTVDNGLATPANYTSATGKMPAFIIGYEKVRGTFTGIMSQCIIEVDADHYVAGTYASGDPLTATNGKFGPAGSNKVIGKVLTFDAASGLMRLMWHESA